MPKAIVPCRASCHGSYLATSLGLLAFCFLFSLVTGNGASQAQTTQSAPEASPADELPIAPLSAAERSLEFADLARDVEELRRYGNILKRVVRLVRPTVVHIEAEKSDELTVRYGASRRQIEEAGSGVIVELNGTPYVLTNRHVIEDASPENIHVKLSDGRQLHPSNVWSHQGTDVAVMALPAPRLVPAKLGDSSDVDMGDFVLAFGSPFGLSHSVTYGIISAKGRRDLKLGAEGVNIQDFIQTDAAINPGNSGGPLLNLRGEVIGINTAIASNSGGNEGIGFAIPINMAIAVARQLIGSGNVVDAYLGVKLDQEFDASAAAQLGLPRRMGARVSGVIPGTPAEAAQLQVGDVILRYDGVLVDEDTHLINMVRLTPAGTKLPVVVLRDGQPITLQVTVSERRRFEQR